MFSTENTLILAIDIQERLVPVLHDSSDFVASCRRLLDGAHILQLPVLITEQYPKGLGSTIADIRLVAKNAPVFEKTQFSALTDEVQAALMQHAPQNVILIGCETHVCILQTALGLCSQGYRVYLPQECVASRTLSNKNNGLAQMQQAGAVVGNIESLLFQILQDAKHPHFKAISKLIQ